MNDQPQSLRPSRDRRAFWGAVTGSLVGMVLGVFLGAGLIAQADNNRRTADVADGPLLIPYDGFLMLNNGAVDGEYNLSFHLYGGPTCTNCELWSETQTVQVHGGRFSVGLGAVQGLDAVILDGEKLYLGMDVDGTALGGRQAIEAVPFAAWAGHGTQFKTNDIVPPSGLVTDVVNVQSSLTMYGTDFRLGTNDGRPQGSRTQNRAMVHSATGDSLVLNFAGDFEGGVQVDSALQATGDLDVDGSTLRLGSGDDRLAIWTSDEFVLNPSAGAATGVFIDSPLRIDGGLRMDATSATNRRIANVDQISGDASLLLTGAAGGTSVTIDSGGGVTIPSDLTVTAGYSDLRGGTSVGGNLNMSSATATSRDITNVNTVVGDGDLYLKGASNASNPVRLESSGTLSGKVFSADTVLVTGTTRTTNNSSGAAFNFVNVSDSEATCGDSPVLGVKLYNSGGKLNIQLRCGPQ